MGPLALGPVGSPPGWVLPGAILDMDFALGRYYGASPADLIFTRALQGFAEYTVSNNRNILGTFASGVPRITDRGLLMEAVATNLCLQSRTFTDVAWTATNMTVAQTSVGADSLANGAARFTAGAVNATVLQTFVLSAANRTVSFYIKRITGSGTVGLCQDGVTFTDISGQLSTNNFVRVFLAVSQLNPICGIRLGTSGDAVDVDFAQYETGLIPSSPIVTTSGTIARPVDTCNVLVQPIGLYGSLFASGTASADAAASRQIAQVDLGNNNDRIGVFRTTGALASFLTVTGAASTSVNGATWSNNADQKVLINWAPAAIRGANAGGTVVSAAPTANTTGDTNLRIGQNASGAQWQGFVKRVALWNTQLPDATMQALTV